MTIEIAVDLDVVRHQMAGGIGASWHSISREMTFDEELLSMDRTNKTARGSSWGGNPPVKDEGKWKSDFHAMIRAMRRQTLQETQPEGLGLPLDHRYTLTVSSGTITDSN